MCQEEFISVIITRLQVSRIASWNSLQSLEHQDQPMPIIGKLRRHNHAQETLTNLMAATPLGIDEMSIRELKQFIDCRGLEWDDCREKSDLQARAREAQDSSSQPLDWHRQENARGESTYINAQTGHRICLTPPGYLSPPTNLRTCTASELTVR